MEHLSDVDIDTIAEQVYLDLDFLEVEDVWYGAGSTKDGYVDPYDLAWEMFEEALEPFLVELKEYQTRSRAFEAKFYCMGILKGIYRFFNESNSPFKDWAGDAPLESFSTVLEQWKADCELSESLKEMEEFISQTCPNWVR